VTQAVELLDLERRIALFAQAITGSAYEVRASETVSLSAPALGRLNIRAQPDNCRVFIDGAFVDYPPILEKQVAAGTHKVAFEWPDGARREQAVEVTTRAPAYVTGRKD